MLYAATLNNTYVSNNILMFSALTYNGDIAKKNWIDIFVVTLMVYCRKPPAVDGSECAISSTTGFLT